MNKTRKTWWLGAAALTLLGIAGKAQAATNPAVLNIDVTVSAALSVQVNTAASSTQTVTWSAGQTSVVSPSSATVTNNSGILSEKWKLSTNATSIDLGTNGTWAVQASTTAVGIDQFALQAVFGSSNTLAGGCPIATSGDWNAASAAPITAAPTTYTSAALADASLAAGGGTPNPDDGANHLLGGSSRALCWRIVTPSGTANPDTQNVQIIVTAF